MSRFSQIHMIFVHRIHTEAKEGIWQPELSVENTTVHRDVSSVHAGEEKPLPGPNKLI